MNYISIKLSRRKRGRKQGTGRRKRGGRMGRTTPQMVLYKVPLYSPPLPTF